MQAQQQQLERAEASHQRSKARLREMEAQLQRHGGAMDGDTDGAKLLDLLRDDVARLRHQVNLHACSRSVNSARRRDVLCCIHA